MVMSRVYARIVCDKWSNVYVWFDNVDLSLKVTRQSINQLWSKENPSLQRATLQRCCSMISLQVPCVCKFPLGGIRC
jgi:hypothetical protein